MGANKKYLAINKIVELETKLRAAQAQAGERQPTLHMVDCIEARQAIESARHVLPTIILSALLQRVAQAEEWLANHA